MGIQNYPPFSSITYHFVWQPMRAKPCLTGEVARRLRILVEERARELEFQPRALIILPDRVYLAAAAPPTLAPHSIVCRRKALTPRALRDEFPELMRTPTLWTRAYLALAGGRVSAEGGVPRYEAWQPPRPTRG